MIVERKLGRSIDFRYQELEKFWFSALHLINIWRLFHIKTLSKFINASELISQPAPPQHNPPAVNSQASLYTHSLEVISVIFMIITNSREEILVYYETRFVLSLTPNKRWTRRVIQSLLESMLSSMRHTKCDSREARSQSHKMRKPSVFERN